MNEWCVRGATINENNTCKYKYNTKIEELKLLIAHEGMMVSEYERHIHEKEELLLENQLKKKKKKRKKKKGNTHVNVQVKKKIKI